VQGRAVVVADVTVSFSVLGRRSRRPPRTKRGRAYDRATQELRARIVAARAYGMFAGQRQTRSNRNSIREIYRSGEGFDISLSVGRVGRSTGSARGFLVEGQRPKGGPIEVTGPAP
jgi:hypothetical protein